MNQSHFVPQVSDIYLPHLLNTQRVNWSRSQHLAHTVYLCQNHVEYQYWIKELNFRNYEAKYLFVRDAWHGVLATYQRQHTSKLFCNCVDQSHTAMGAEVENQRVFHVPDLELPMKPHGLHRMTSGVHMALSEGRSRTAYSRRRSTVIPVTSPYLPRVTGVSFPLGLQRPRTWCPGNCSAGSKEVSS